MKKKIVAMILVIAMILTMAGCSSDSKKLVGTWRCEKDMTGIMEQLLFGDTEDDLADYLELSRLTFVCYMEFRDDGTYRIYADEDSLRGMFDVMVDDMMDALEAYLVDMFYETSGMTMTFEEILELTGMSMDDVIESMNLDEIIEETLDEVEQEGKYKAADGKLHTSLGLNYEVDPSVYETYTLNDSTLTITGCVGMEADDLDFYPMVFKQVK